MLNKIVETGKTDDSVIISLNILVMHVTKIIFVSFVAKLDMLATTIGIITIGTGMLGTMFWIEICMIKTTSVVFNQRTRDNTYINSSFLKVDHA